MFNKLAQSIAIRHIIKLAKPEDLPTPMEQTEASIGRDSRNNLTKSNVDRNTQHLDNLAKGQLEGSKMAINALAMKVPNAPGYVQKANTASTAHDIYSNSSDVTQALNSKNTSKANKAAPTPTQDSTALNELRRGLTDPSAWMP